MDKISVITVVYNDMEGLSRTMNSVFEQTYLCVEYIIIDGGSLDGTVNLIKHNQHKIKYWVSEPDKGIYDAMNKGIKKATGDWLCFMNAGDTFASDRVLEDVFNLIIPDEITFLYSNYYGIRPNGEKVLRKSSFNDGILIHQSIIYRRSLHFQHGYYIVTPKIIISDYLFFIRIPESQVMKIEPIIAIYQGGGVSSMGDWTRKQAICADVVFRRRTFGGMIRYYIWRKIKSIIPIEIKDEIKILFKKEGEAI